MDTQHNLIFRTAHGDRSLAATGTDSIIDVCHRYGIPVTQVTCYLGNPHGELSLVVRPHQPIGTYIGDAQLVLFPNRNIDYHGLLGGGEIVRERPGASTWMRLRERGQDGEESFVTELLSPAQAQEIVAAQVKEGLEAAAVSDEPLVVGVSGGGDSNALLGAIVKSGLVSPANIHPVMMLGIPDWDKGVERAEAICAEHHLKLRRVEDDETARLLGFADPGKDWVTAFEKAFPRDDLEVLGVYGVRRVLESVALEVRARKIVIGTNLEDCLSDALYYLCHGRVPFPKPVGAMGQVAVVCPLWLTAKALIDGCYPKYSRENYEARYPSRMRGRAYYYYLAQMLVDAYPGAAQDILRGVSELSRGNFQELPYDPEFRTPMISQMPFDLRIKLRNLFGASTVV